MSTTPGFEAAADTAPPAAPPMGRMTPPSGNATRLLAGALPSVLGYGAARGALALTGVPAVRATVSAVVFAAVVSAGLLVVVGPERRQRLTPGVVQAAVVVVAAAVAFPGWPAWRAYAIAAAVLLIADGTLELFRVGWLRGGGANLGAGWPNEAGLVWLLRRRRRVVAVVPVALAAATALQTTDWIPAGWGLREPGGWGPTVFAWAITMAWMVWMYRRLVGPLWAFVAARTTPWWRLPGPKTGAELAAAAYRRVGVGLAVDPVGQYRQSLAAALTGVDVRPGDLVFLRSDPAGVVDRSAIYVGRDQIVDVVAGRAQLVALPAGEMVAVGRPAAQVGEPRPWPPTPSQLFLAVGRRRWRDRWRLLVVVFAVLAWTVGYLAAGTPW